MSAIQYLVSFALLSGFLLWIPTFPFLMDAPLLVQQIFQTVTVGVMFWCLGQLAQGR